MCNRFRSIKDWSEIPRGLISGPRLNFESNPNVAPTELVPIFIAQPDGPPKSVIARFGINLTGKDGKPRPPLLNARTDGLRRGQFRTHMKGGRCVIPAQGFYEWREEGGKQPTISRAPTLRRSCWRASGTSRNTRGTGGLPSPA